MIQPKISVVTVCYNAAATIEKTMLSVINQTYENIEYIIIDGGSTDGTVDIIKKYADRIAYWVSEPDKGIYDAMNKGIKVATGEWINFMNAGDSFVDETVLHKVFGNKNYSSYDAIYGDAYYLRTKGMEYVSGKKVCFIERNMPNTHQAFFVKTSKAKIIGFDLSYKYASDYNMIYHTYRENNGGNILYIPIIICEYEAINGFTMKAGLAIQREVLAIRNHNIRWYYDMLKYKIKTVINNHK